MSYPLAYADVSHRYSDDQISPADKSFQGSLPKLARALLVKKSNHDTNPFSSFNAGPLLREDGKQRTEVPPEDYPPMIGFGRQYDKAKELSSLRGALNKGFNPNTIWSRNEIRPPSPQGGCTIYPSSEYNRWQFYNSPLHRALFYEDFDSAEILFQNGAEPDSLNSRGQTPLHVAIEFDRGAVVEYLIAKNADVNKLAKRTAHDSEDQEVEGVWHPLHLALLTGHIDILRLLIKAGSDVNHVSGPSWSILDLALLARNGQAIRLLLDHGARLLSYKPDGTDNADSSQLGADAKALLSCTTTSTLIPPPHLRSIYRHSLTLVDTPLLPGMSHEAVETWVNEFFRNLCVIANMEDFGLNQTLCGECIKLQKQMTEPDDTWLAHPIFKLHDDRQTLQNCADHGCYLCGRVQHELSYNACSWEAPFLKDIWNDGLPDDSVVYIISRIGPNYHQGTVPGANFVVACRGEWVSLDTRNFRRPFQSMIEASRDCSQGLGSRITLQTAKEWLENCKSSHSCCQRSYEFNKQVAELPARLIYVGDDSREPYLDGQVDSRLDWCALSYCWGTSPNNASTTLANLSGRLKRIDLATFPDIIRDAVATTKALGYTHLWVDAVCIIQDDDDDWNREASKMHAIYAKAQLTISSLVAKDCTERLFRPRLRPDNARPIPLAMYLPKRFRPRDDGSGALWNIAVADRLSMASDLKLDAPVHSRGWTLQEQLLSSRILYFGDNRIHWDCLYGYREDENPEEYNARYTGSSTYMSAITEMKNAQYLIKGVLEDKSNNDWPTKYFEVWKKEVSSFTSRQLSKPSDRIPAFMAVSKYIEGPMNDKFLGGIWTQGKCLESLCWSVNYPGVAQPKSPSWTWASLAGQITFLYLARGGTKTPKAKVISVDVKTDQSQRQVFGSISLQGTLHKKGCSLAEELDDMKQRLDRGTTGPSGDYLSTGCQATFDSDKLEAKEWYAFDMIFFGKESEYKGFGYPAPRRDQGLVRLLLQPVEGRLLTFRRIGIEICQPSEYFWKCSGKGSRGNKSCVNSDLRREVSITIV